MIYFVFLGYNGVFISGANPHWLFLTPRGELRTHPMTIDGEILCFTSFNNVNCPQGFLYFNRKVTKPYFIFSCLIQSSFIYFDVAPNFFILLSVCENFTIFLLYHLF